MEETVKKFRVINLNEEFLGAAPEPGRLAWMTKLLIQIRRDYQYKLLADQQFQCHQYGERIIILTSGGISMITKSFAQPIAKK